MLWRYCHHYTSYAVRVFSSPAWARARRHEYGRSERATRMNLYSHARCNSVHKELRMSRSIIALTERASQASVRSHLPIMFASRVSFLRPLHVWTPFFWKYIEQFFRYNTVYNINCNIVKRIHRNTMCVFSTPCNFYVKSMLYQ